MLMTTDNIDLTLKGALGRPVQQYFHKYLLFLAKYYWTTIGPEEGVPFLISDIPNIGQNCDSLKVNVISIPIVLY